MKRGIKKMLTRTIKALTGKKIIFSNPSNRPTATLSDLGFWYAGDVFDTADIAYGVSQNGLVESDETNLVITILDSIIKENGFLSLYDIGANTGYYGILAGARYGTKATVNSFEPILAHTVSLRQSIYLNRLEDVVRIHQIALGNKNSEQTIYVAGSGTSLSKDFIQGQHESTERVDVKRLDDLLDSGMIGTGPDFIKIDVEGYEQSVLEGSIKALSSNLPILYIEIAQTLKGLGRPGFESKSYAETFTFLGKLGYEPFINEGSKIMPVDPNVPFDGVRMYLFLHKERHTGLKSSLMR